jgi:hypothetical protein
VHGYLSHANNIFLEMIGVFMKALSSSCYVLIGLVGLLLSASAYAENKGAMHVSSPLTIGGERLTSGDYTVRWVGTGSNVELDIMHGKRKIATVMAVMKHLQDTSVSDAVTITEDSSGSKKLSQIFFSGKDFVLEVEQLPIVARASGSN